MSVSNHKPPEGASPARVPEAVERDAPNFRVDYNDSTPEKAFPGYGHTTYATEREARDAAAANGSSAASVDSAHAP